jgi:hypothetical protein
MDLNDSSAKSQILYHHFFSISISNPLSSLSPCYHGTSIAATASLLVVANTSAATQFNTEPMPAF